jgi:hypothetical protein
MRFKAPFILIVGVGIPLMLFAQTNHIFEGVNGTHIGQKTTDKIGYWGATPIPKPIITGSLTAASLEAALASAGLVATATPSASSTATATATPTP